MIQRPTERFTGRADAYARARPHYPEEVIQVLRQRCGLGSGMTVADIGAGTGIFSRQLAQTGAHVIAVEPNDDMRSHIDPAPNLVPWRGTAEQTGLPDRTVHLVTAAQAFHWFEPQAARAEWQRILVPPGWVALVWNTRVADPGTLHGAMLDLMYEFARKRLGTGTDLDQTRSNADLALEYDLKGETFRHSLIVDRDAFIANACSSSFVPRSGEVLFEPFVKELSELFDRFAPSGCATLEYRTELYLGKLLA